MVSRPTTRKEEGGSGGCLPGGVCPGRGCVSAQEGCLPRGVSAQGVSTQGEEGICSWGYLGRHHPSRQTATAAASTHPTGMHSCYLTEYLAVRLRSVEAPSTMSTVPGNSVQNVGATVKTKRNVKRGVKVSVDVKSYRFGTIGTFTPIKSEIFHFLSFFPPYS